MLIIICLLILKMNKFYLKIQHIKFCKAIKFNEYANIHKFYVYNKIYKAIFY